MALGERHHPDGLLRHVRGREETRANGGCGQGGDNTPWHVPNPGDKPVDGV